MATSQNGFKTFLWMVLILIALTACQVTPTSSPEQPTQFPSSAMPAAFANCRHDYEGIWYCTRENGRYRVLYTDLSNPSVRVDVVMARYSTNPQEPVTETVEQMVRRYGDRFPGLQVVAGINANYFGPGHHGPQGLIKATTRQGGSPSGQYITLFSPYLNSQTHDGVELISSLGISSDERLLMDRDFYNQHAGWIGGSTGGGRALTAGPRIVWQGAVLPEDRFAENCSDEGHPTSYCTQARPRSALGVIDQQGLVLTVGQKDLLRNTALLLQQHGVDHAMKLDDGSSAQLWYVDAPFAPGGGGGAVANALLIYSKPLGEPSVVASSSTVFLVDVSGSMDEPWRGGVKIESAKQAATSVINMIEQESQIGGSNHQVAVATFTTDAYLDLELTTDYDSALQTINGLVPLDRTNIGAGLQMANQALSSAPSGAQKIIILLSDGLTNEGLSPEDILSGPVKEAAASNACIYTVGFGEPGDLDEDLLREIASGATCGEYHYASAPDDLERVYIRLRHQSLGTILQELEGQVAQGETADAGQVEVPRNQGEMYVTLHWPGSDLDLIVTDPRGREVKESDPGVSLVSYGNMIYLIIENPRAGNWLLQVFGADVPEGVLNYDAIISVRERTGPLPVDTGGLLIGLGLVALIAIGFVVLVTSGRPIQQGQAGLQLLEGQASRSFVPLRRKPLTIGRAPGCGLVLSDPQASARHAQIQRTTQGYVLTDLGSKNGTFINEQRSQRVLLRGGERLRMGQTELVFTMPGYGTGAQPPPQPSPSTAAAYLAVMVGGQEFARYPVAPDTVLGRYTGCPVDLSADMRVSRQHARLDYQGGQWIITDLGSGNGTFVNGQQVHQQALRPGDDLRLGNTRMRFYIVY